MPPSRISTAPEDQTPEQEACDHENVTYTGSDVRDSYRIERGTCDDCGQRVATVWELGGTEEIGGVNDQQIINDYRDELSERWP